MSKLDLQALEIYRQNKLAEQQARNPLPPQGALADVVDVTQKGLYDGAAGIGEMVGLDSVRDWGQEGAAEQLRTISPVGQQAMQKTFFDENTPGTVTMGDAWTDPRAIAMQFGHTLGLNADILMGGGALKAGKMAVTSVAKEARKRMLAQTGDKVLADEAAAAATQSFMKKQFGDKADMISGYAGDTLAFGAAGHAVSGGLGAIDIGAEVESMDFEELVDSPEFVQLVKQNKQMNPGMPANELLAQSRSELAEISRTAVKTNPALLTSNLLVGGLGTAALTRIFSGAMPKGAGISAEFATEAAQGGIEQFAKNQVVQENINPTQTLDEGMTAAALNEGVMGAGMGAATAGAGALYQKAQGALKKDQPTAPVAEATPAASVLPDIQEVPELYEPLNPGQDPMGAFVQKATEVSKTHPHVVDMIGEIALAEPEKAKAAVSVLDNFMASPDFARRTVARMAEYMRDPAATAEPDAQEQQDVQSLISVIGRQDEGMAQQLKTYVEQNPAKTTVALTVASRYLADPEFRPKAETQIANYLQQQSQPVTNTAQKPAIADQLSEEMPIGSIPSDVDAQADIDSLAYAQQTADFETALSADQMSVEAIAETAPAAEVDTVDAYKEASTYVRSLPIDQRGKVTKQMLKDTFGIDDDQALELMPWEKLSTKTVGNSENDNEIKAAIDSAAAEAALSTQNDLPEPTAAQKEAGNYRKGHTRVYGLDIAIENPAGSKRSGTDAKGKEWSVDMQDHYGYIKRTEGADGDHVDVFIGQNPASQKVFVVDQYKADGSFDEHKVVFGANDLDDAIETYSRNYSAGWNVGPVAEMSVDEFKDWLKTGDTKAPLTRFDDAPQNVLADFGQLRIEPYSEKSVVVRGDTKAYRDQLKNLKGTFNPRLKGGEGWVFGKARLDELTKALPGIVQRDERRQENEQLSAAPDSDKPDLFAAAYQRQNELAARARVHDADLAQRIETVLPPEQEASFDAGRVQTQLDKYEKQVALNEKREAIKRPKEKAEPAPQTKGVNQSGRKTPPVDVNIDDKPAEKTEDKATPLANATAPEHVMLGVDDRSLEEIVEGFNNAMADMLEDGHPVTNIFVQPKKSEVVRLEQKVKVYHKDHGWMTPAEARAKIDKWKAHAAAQYDDYKTRSANNDKVVLSLFDKSGQWSQPWEDAGYQVYRFDIQNDPELGDVNNFSTEFFGDWFGDFEGMDIYAILAACPCTDFASSGARHFAAKDEDGRTVSSVKLVHQTLRTIEFFRPAVWALENPVGRIEKLGGLPNWRLSFDPNHMGETYTKKTLIWGRFNGDLPIAPVDPVEGSKMHQKYGGKSMATKNARSVTPEGFAYSFFMANNAADHPAMAFANKFDRLDRSLIEKAIAAGVSASEIESEIEDFYYIDLDDDAANQAIRDLIPKDKTVKTEPITPKASGKKSLPSGADAVAAVRLVKGLAKAKTAAQKPKDRILSDIAYTLKIARRKGGENGDARLERFNDVIQQYTKLVGKTAAEIESDIGNDAAVKAFMKRVGIDTYTKNKQSRIAAIMAWRDASVRRLNEVSKTGKMFDAVQADIFAKKPVSVDTLNDMRLLPLPGGYKLDENTAIYQQHDYYVASTLGWPNVFPKGAPAEKQKQQILDTVGQLSFDAASILDGLPVAAVRESMQDAASVTAGRAHDTMLKNGLTRAMRDAIGLPKELDGLAARFLREAYLRGYQPKNAGVKAQKPASSNTIFTDDAAEKARALLRSKLGQLNSGIDPEILQAGLTLAGWHVEKGARRFADFVKAMLADMGGSVQPYLKSWYMGIKYDPRASGFEGMSSSAEVELYDFNQMGADDDVSITGVDVEPDSAESGNSQRQPAQSDDDGAAATGAVPGNSKRAADDSVRAEGGASVSDDDGTVSGAQSAAELLQPDGAIKPAGKPSGAGKSGRSNRDNDDGAKAKQQGTAATEAVTRQLKQHNKTPPATRKNVWGDSADIAESLPVLLPAQVGDLERIENRFFGSENPGPGYLNTNGTGTGKTFVGLGLIKRLAQTGKQNVLVVVPNDGIAQQWVKSGRDHFELEIYQLGSDGGRKTTDPGRGITITSYATFGENAKLISERGEYDLIITDEAQNLMASQQANKTKALTALRAMTNHHSGHYARASAFYADDLKAVEDKIEAYKAKLISDAETAGRRAPTEQQLTEQAREKYKDQLNTVWGKVNKKRDVFKEQPQLDTKVLFLSATPFPYQRNLDYAEGYLFRYEEYGEKHEGGYDNAFHGHNAFYIQSFGYDWKYHKLNKPGADVDSALMERQFHEKLKAKGVLGGRAIEVDADYSREFALVETAAGQKLDDLIELFRDYEVPGETEGSKENPYRKLADALDSTFDYTARIKLLEAIKAPDAVDKARKHLAKGRKVVIFHSYNVGGALNPIAKLRAAEPELMAQFEAQFPGKADIDFGNLAVPLRLFEGAFGDRVGFYNGTVTETERRRVKEAFNQDGSGLDVLVVQQEAGEAGISLHDTTGKHQRVLINMGIPGRPTQLIQIEGRTYRVGVVTDAHYTYLTTGTAFERQLFASKIAGRASTAENLGMGDLARGLKESISEAYLDADFREVSDEIGKGGKARDKSADVDVWDKAKTYYWANLKRTQKTKSAEGDDYFATPEPLGLKMVQWLQPKPGHRLLEPSVGHAAIGRWFGGNTRNKAIERSFKLASLASMNFPGEVVNDSFENYSVMNKFDGIAMNPPFGRGGATAYAHIRKAVSHLANGGRIVALVPDGPAANKQLEKMLTDEKLANIYQAAEVDLPAGVFERAGTGVKTKIIVLDRFDNPEDAPQQQRISLTGSSDVNAFFERVRDIDLKERNTATPKEVDPWQFMDHLMEPERFGKTEFYRLQFHGSLPDELQAILKNDVDLFDGEKAKKPEEFRFFSDDGRQAFAQHAARLIDEANESGAGVKFRVPKKKFVAGSKLVDVPASLGPSSMRDSFGNAPRGGHVSESLELRKLKAFVARFDRRLADAGAGTQVVEYFAQLADHLPSEVVDQIDTDTQGFLYQNKVYLIGNRIRSLAHAQEVMIHERLRHAGVRKLFGNDFWKVMNKMAYAIGPRQLNLLAKKYGVDVDAYRFTYKRNRHPFPEAALLDEVIAHIKESDVPKGIWQKIKEILSMFRAILRNWGMSEWLDSFGEHDAEIMRVLKMAQREITDKGPTPPKRTTKADNFDAPAMLGRTGDAIVDSVSQINTERLQRWAQLFKPSKIGAAVKSKWQDYRPKMLQALPRNYLADIGGHLLPSLRRYNAQVAMMEAQRNDLLGAVHETADKWRKLVGKQPGASAKLADLMHEATLMGVDPSESKFTPAITRGTYEILMRNAKAFIKSRNGEAEAVARGMERRRKIQAAMDRVPTQERAYENMRKDFLALPPEHQALFMEVRDSYKKMNAERVTALEKRIEDLIADKRVAGAQISMMREEFELNDLNGIYFPLQRFGKYKAVVKGKADGQVLAFSMFETHAQMREWMAEQEAPDVTVQGGYQSEFSSRTDGVSAGFMKDLLQKFGPVLSKNNKIQDDLYQLFLEHSPDLSMRKHSIHRKGVAGFSEDALRAFAHNQFHSAYQIAKVSHTHHMQSHIIALDDEANAIEQTDDRVKAIQVVNELRQRNDWILSPKGSELANKLTGFGFFWYLGTSPAAALVNITQTAMVGLPVIGARYGFKETARVMGQMSKAFIKGKGNVDNTLTGRELSAFRELEKSGIIDKTMAHDMTGIAEGGISYSPKYHMVMKTAGWMFHHAERFNREVTAMSAYRLAFDKFKAKHSEALAHNLAVTEAIDMTRLSHFDYANSNRPRFMQGDVARVVLLFRQHSVNMTYRLIRDFQQSFWGDGADKKIAQRQLAGMLGMTLFFAGAAGLPLYSVIAGIFNTMLDDEDDPFDFDDAVREVLAEAIGDTAASVIMSGAPGTALDVDLTNRVGMNNLWFRDPEADVEGEAAVQYYAEQVLGPMYGILAGWGKAASLAREGHTGRAWEAAVPKFARDWFKSVRFADEGILTKRGDPIIDEVSPWQIALTANGFTSLEVSDQYRINNALSGAQRRLRDRRQLLLNRYALARRLSDQMAVNEALAEIERFNDAQPTLKISVADRVKSLKQRKRLSDRAVNGVVLDKKLAHLAE